MSDDLDQPVKRSHTPEQCRVEAAECRRRANSTFDRRERARWADQANLWEKFAAELDGEGQRAKQ